MPPTPLSQERLAEIANQSFVTEDNQKAFGVDKKEDVAQVDYKPARGITTSRDAENRAKAANETINNITTPSSDDNNPFADLFKRINTLQSDLNKAKASEQAAKDEAAGVDAGSALKKLNSAEEAGKGASTDMSAGVDAIAGRGGTEGIEDATIRALADKTSANLAIIGNQMQTLGQYRQQFNEYTQQDIDSIARTAERSVQRQLEENQRTTDAMRFAGVVAGRAQFAPVPEQSIIAEVIQDGLDEIEVINEKKNSAIREARKAEAEFNVDVFEQQAELAKEYNNEIESTISAMNARVRQVEQDEREAMTFRQEQEERSAIMLAGELIDADPDKIMQAAAINGIDVGLLTKAVNDAKFEKQSRELDIKSSEESILTSQVSRQLDQARFNREGQESTESESDIPKDVEQGFRSVARLSQADAEASWNDIKTFGLDESVSIWLEGGLDKSQVKAMVSAHEQSQRQKDEDGIVQPTQTEKDLLSKIDSWDNRTETQKKMDEFKGQTISSPETFFKQQ